MFFNQFFLESNMFYLKKIIYFMYFKFQINQFKYDASRKKLLCKIRSQNYVWYDYKMKKKSEIFGGFQLLFLIYFVLAKLSLSYLLMSILYTFKRRRRTRHATHDFNNIYVPCNTRGFPSSCKCHHLFPISNWRVGAPVQSYSARWYRVSNSNISPCHWSKTNI